MENRQDLYEGCQVSGILPDCPVFWLFVRYKNDSRLVQYNACVNRSIFCDTDTGTTSVRYFGENHLATLTVPQVAYPISNAKIGLRQTLITSCKNGVCLMVSPIVLNET